MFSFSKSDKVLVVAPHPDDESLGAGGLLQRIFAQRIPVRILFATNGENNPWAQRFWESRWQIGPNERVRWGQRRRQETLNAISTLGGKPDCARFLNLPDLGTTNLLMQGGHLSVGKQGQVGRTAFAFAKVVSIRFYSMRLQTWFASSKFRCSAFRPNLIVFFA
jgi:LmbE family N-acetylglucosaminyl deacetylase